MSEGPSEKSRARVRKLVESYCEKSGTTTHPEESVTESVELGLAANLDELGKPLCPCRFYPDKKAEAKHRTWICPCDDMQIYSIATVCCSWTGKGGPSPSTFPRSTRAAKSTTS